MTTAVQVDVLITGDAAAIRAAGLGPECLAGSRLAGVAVAGDLREPEVVTDTVTLNASTCTAARFIITEWLGIPMPRIPTT